MTSVTQDETAQQTTINKTAKQAKKPRSPGNLVTRLITGMVILPFMVFVILWGGWVFAIPLMVLASIGTLEFFFMERSKGVYNNALLGLAATIAIIISFQVQEPLLWQGAMIVFGIITFIVEFVQNRQFWLSLRRVAMSLGGVLYIAFPFAFFIAIRQVQPFGIHWAFSVIFATWTTDTLAYVLGNMFGKHKLAPALSPGKTLEGAIGGAIFGALMPMLVLMRAGEWSAGAAIMLMIAAVAAIGGDLFESGIKRYFGIKDSHLPGFDVLPGHGGVLDRVDALLWVLIVHYFFLLLVGKVPLLI